ncbi:MAG: 2-oxoglutarate dehydrogenase E1/E2 component [Chlamydiia bacterium]|nr:2-oxoglutarate dehydrogenase E1/E2 component [Chlamydiia bacterium]MCH9618216.1 2-oxoglutarate dehydrogenase E1/E2 component [Chlamydiia bacterium]MCH9624061.1 2-oxoglutarate dehydrogenase E1/E2 component [Chlamydiia bacterium]
MQEDEFLHFENEGYIYDLFEKYQKDKSAVPKEWLRFFQGVELGEGASGGSAKGFDVERVVDYFKSCGHLYADTNSMVERKEFDKQKLLEHLSLKEQDLNQKVSVNSLDIKEITLNSLIDRLKDIYCGSLGIEFFTPQGSPQQDFFHKEVFHAEEISQAMMVNALKEVGKAKLLEDFLQKKFLGAKRFSVEGGESVLSLLKGIIDEGGERGFSEGYIGMAHRGRINTLCHIMEKPYADIFTEFKTDRFPDQAGMGDVKYHNGYENRVKTYGGKEMYLQIAANPSHLEAVDGLLPGMIRARLDDGLDKALGIVIHGDASAAGQGIVYETMQFNKLDGYSNGGTIHVVIDNQIGFTATSEESRSTLYPTDIAKAFDMPVIHVDAWDIAAVMKAAKIAVRYKDTFGEDIFIHYNCHRLYGHNEGDEPVFTNPTLYKKIRSSKDLFATLKEEFLAKDWIKSEDMQAFEKDIKEKLSRGLEGVQGGLDAPLEDYVALDNSLEQEEEAYPLLETKISKEVFDTVKGAITTVPEGVNIHPKVGKLIETRALMLTNIDEQLLDWGCAELMAYGSLILEGKKVRLSGQDSRRGTFSHRHSVYIDQENEKAYLPLDKVMEGAFTVYNSPLSEYGVMGFEYGYSLKMGEGLVIWEGQFGDFYNGATIIVDQYISACKSKWGDSSSLILYLPHGNEGMGPEHSSARIERFLQLAGRKNMRIFYPTTSAQIYHLIRSQALCEDRIPLIIFTPKSQLRAPSSAAKELLEGKLEQVIVKGTGAEEKVVFCSGKIAAEIERKDRENSCAIIKIEQLYPFPQKAVEEALKKFSGATNFVFAQEEPENQGAYSFAKDYIAQIIPKKATLEYVGRKRLESTAVGFSSVFKYHQEKIIKKVVEG